MPFYEERRKVGENDSFVCGLIRSDDVKGFVSYSTQTCLSLNSKIPNAIFETNCFLLENPPSLIEYAAFYGSLQVFKYLQLNKVEIKPSLWKVAIHGRNSEIIHILEETITENDPISCLKEAIKCHHNEIVNYIRENLIFINDIIQKMTLKF